MAINFINSYSSMDNNIVYKVVVIDIDNNK